MPRNTALVALKIVLAVVACSALIIGGPYLLDRMAERKATAFCEAANVGSSTAELEARADSASIKQYIKRSDVEYVFFFHGFIFDTAACRIQVLNGKVVSKTSTKAID